VIQRVEGTRTLSWRLKRRDIDDEDGVGGLICVPGSHFLFEASLCAPRTVCVSFYPSPALSSAPVIFDGQPVEHLDIVLFVGIRQSQPLHDLGLPFHSLITSLCTIHHKVVPLWICRSKA
jgi:hypothetical protein